MQKRRYLYTFILESIMNHSFIVYHISITRSLRKNKAKTTRLFSESGFFLSLFLFFFVACLTLFEEP